MNQLIVQFRITTRVCRREIADKTISLPIAHLIQPPYICDISSPAVSSPPSKDHGSLLHFKRRPVKIEIQSVNYRYSSDRINNYLQNGRPANSFISPIREGKPHGRSLDNRSLMFNVDSIGFKFLFSELNGSLSYVDMANRSRTSLKMRIAMKPYRCRRCYIIGHHKCPGLVCHNCGDSDHKANDCRSSVNFCKNCNKEGHRARDSDCPTYIYHFVRELLKSDIPLAYFEDDTLRFKLIRWVAIN